MSIQKNIDDEFLVSVCGSVMCGTLNRPHSLNALTLDMMRQLSSNLKHWESDESVKAVFLTGAGDRAFCAGGNIKAVYYEGLAYREGETTENTMVRFFYEEYSMNRQIFHYKKPICAFMNGITMGGGFGVAGPCRFRIISESTVFAMPEVGIGFSTDVGSVFFLSKCPGEIGTYLGLTGHKIGPEDMLYCGLASHYIPLEKQNDCRNALSKIIEEANHDALDEGIKIVLDEFAEEPKAEGYLRENQPLVDLCFSANSIEEVLSRLRDKGSDWGKETANLMESRSPTSLKVVLAHLRKGKADSFDEVTSRDFVLSQHFLEGHDFYEGIRAQLIDKDKTPRWMPSRLSDVDETLVDHYFSMAGRILDE